MADGHPRADGGGAHHLPAAVRRPAAEVGSRVRGGGPPRVGVPRRADRRHGCARANCRVGVDQWTAPRRRDGGIDNPSADRGRGTGRPDRDHRPRGRGCHWSACGADAQRRGESAAIPRAADARSVTAGVGVARELQGDRNRPGRVPGRGQHRPAGAGHRHRVVRATGCASNRHASRAAQPRGRLSRTDRPGVAIVTNLFAPGTFSPDPRPATVQKMLAAQFGLELKLLLRNGEQLLLTMFIPITLLVGLTLLPLGSFGPNRAATFVPAIMALAVISTAFTGQAIAVAFDRRYGALKRLGATALPVWGIIAGKSLAVVTVVFLQSILLGAIGLGLGWRPNILGLAL